jgi:hypothetical protein
VRDLGRRLDRLAKSSGFGGETMNLPTLRTEHVDRKLADAGEAGRIRIDAADDVLAALGTRKY